MDDNCPLDHFSICCQVESLSRRDIKSLIGLKATNLCFVNSDVYVTVPFSCSHIQTESGSDKP